MVQLLKNKLILLISLLLISLACSEDGPTELNKEENASNIKDYISKLSYNSEEMLNYQSTGGTDSEKEELSDSSETITSGNYTTLCKRTTYNLKKNFEQVAILRPTSGIVWPGALVKGNQSLMDGVPEPISIERAPITISVNLPGIGENGIRTVNSPAASSVQAAIDSSLQWWNDNAYEEGYVNAANSSYNLTTSYSSEQMALDVDLNAEWATGAVSTQFGFTSDEEKKVVMAVYKQAFYDVIFDTPTSPEKVFDENVSLSNIESVINDAAAPAYIKSVTYGRIIMFRMESISSYRSADIQAAFDYAAGYSVDGSLQATYDEILETSSIDLVVIGGNAAVATEPISSAGSNNSETILEKVQGIISGENAVYSKDNPGVPIGYTVFYLKDNSLAKLGYTTEYTAKECITTKSTNTITLYLDQFTVSQDCDGWPLGDGEFYFYIEILNQNNQLITSYSSAWGSYGDGDNFKINQTKIFNMTVGVDKRFTIKLTCYEKDYDLFGNPHYDDRMNGRSNSITYTNYDDGSWSDGLSYDYVYTKYLYLGESNCNVNLKYSIKVE